MMVSNFTVIPANRKSRRGEMEMSPLTPWKAHLIWGHMVERWRFEGQRHFKHVRTFCNTKLRKWINIQELVTKVCNQFHQLCFLINHFDLFARHNKKTAHRRLAAPEVTSLNEMHSLKIVLMKLKTSKGFVVLMHDWNRSQARWTVSLFTHEGGLKDDIIDSECQPQPFAFILFCSYSLCNYR